MESQTIKIEGMSCDHCVARVRNALAGLENVQVESVQIGEAVVSVPSDSSIRDAVLAAIQSAGYTAE